MRARLANRGDYDIIVKKLNNFEKIDYLTEKHVKMDIMHRNCYVLEDNGEIVAIGSIIYDNDFKMHYIKRLMVLDVKMKRKGYGRYMMEYLSGTKPLIATTPWNDNHIMKKLLKSLGFEYKYTFLENYELFVKSN